MKPQETEDEEFASTRPSSWSAALSQLPGLASENTAHLPPLAGKPRDVSPVVDEDLDGDES